MTRAAGRLWLMLLGAALGASACGVPGRAIDPEPDELVVFAAGSLINVFEEVGEQFEAAHPGVQVAFNFAGSQALRTQILEGAAADVYASANEPEMDAIITGGRVAEGSSRIFARNSLVIITPTQALAAIETPADLARPGVKLVLADEQVPVGRYARQALENLNEVYGPDFSRSVLANVVSNEDSVVGVTAKVRLGEADAGIVFVTDAAAEDSVKSIGIDEAHNVLAAYPIALVSDARSADVGRQFIEFLLSSDGQAILADFGFIPVEAD